MPSSNMEPVSIRCNLCTHKSDTFAHLRTHLQSFHENCEIGYECFFCGKHLKNPYLHREHLRRRHGDHCDFTTPPPTGRINPKLLAKRPGTYIPPMEARTMPTPPKRRRSKQQVSKPPSPPPVPFNLDAILKSDLMVSDEEDVTPSCDKSIQVRRRDFLTTSREIQATVPMVNQFSQINQHVKQVNMGPQTVSNSRDCQSQTSGPITQLRSTGTQTNYIKPSSDASTQASFFNGGWLTRHLMDAIRAIAPTILNNQTTTSVRPAMYITPNNNQPDSDRTT